MSGCSVVSPASCPSRSTLSAARYACSTSLCWSLSTAWLFVFEVALSVRRIPARNPALMYLSDAASYTAVVRSSRLLDESHGFAGFHLRPFPAERDFIPACPEADEVSWRRGGRLTTASTTASAASAASGSLLTQAGLASHETSATSLLIPAGPAGNGIGAPGGTASNAVRAIKF